MSGWRSTTLGQVIDLQRGHDLTEQARRPGKVPVIGSAGQNGWHDTPKAAAPGVTVGRSGASAGVVTFVPEAFWPHNTVLYVTDFKGNDPRFVAYMLGQMPLAEMNSGAAQPSLNRNFLYPLPVRLPPLPTQRRIASILGAYDDLIEVNRRRIALLEEMARRLFEEWFVHFRFPGHEGVRMVETPEGPLPEGWSWRPLRDVCERPDGVQTGPFGSQLHQSDYSDEGVPVVMPKNIVGFRIVEEAVARIPEQLADELGRHRMRVGDVVYGRRGDIGRRAFVAKREHGWFCGTGCLRLRPDRAIVAPRYLFETLGLPVTFSAIKARAQGATMPNLSTGALGGVPIMVPPLALQRHYAEVAEPLAELATALAAANDALARSRDLLLPRLISGDLPVAAAGRELETAA
jgi:type I restriction enzyme S subunit